MIVQATKVRAKVQSADVHRDGIESRMFRRIPFDKVNWTISSFLIGTFLLSLTLVPAYIWDFGLDWFQITLFLVMFCAAGFSITLGYHRLYSPHIPGALEHPALHADLWRSGL